MKKILIILIGFTFVFSETYKYNSDTLSAVDKLNNAGKELVKAEKFYYWGYFLTLIFPTVIAISDEELYNENDGEIFALQFIGALLSFSAFSHVGNAGLELESITEDDID